MKVLHLDLGKHLRGGQRQVLYLTKHQQINDRITPIIACPNNSALYNVATAENIPVWPLSTCRPWSLCLIKQLVTKLKKHEVTILHTHDAQAALLGALLKKLVPNCCLIHTRRVSYPLGTGLSLWKYRKADAVVGVSQEISEKLIYGGLEAQNVFTIHSGIDPKTYKKTTAINTDCFHFLAIGALTPQKGFSVLLNACALLIQQKNVPSWRVQLVGTGPLLTDLQHQAESLHLDTHLVMSGRQESRTVLPQSQALIVPSVDGEGSSAVIKEGWATGIPVISSDLPSNTELAQDTYNALTFKSGDPHALALAMQRVLLEPKLRQQLVAGGDRTLHTFTDTCMAEAYTPIYHNILNNIGKPS